MRILLLMLVLFAAALGHAESEYKPTIVIVHGAWGGGWAFRDVERELRARGYDVYRPTLTGQGERVHLASPSVNLTTHITDVVNVLRFEELENVVLVGHSYGGMVVTSVADRESARVSKLVYLDAIVPGDGDSWLSMSDDAGREWLESNTTDAGVMAPWVNADASPPKDVPHPAGTLSEAVSLSGAVYEIPTEYILTAVDASKPGADEFAQFAEVARGHGWPVHVLESDHNPQWSDVDELVAMLDKIASAAE